MRSTVAQLHDRGLSVRRRLIGQREAGQASLDDIRGHLVGGLESVEAAAVHEQQQVAHHLAGGADLAAIAVAFAQQPRLGKGAAVVEFGKLQCDHRQATEIAGELLDRIARLEAHTQRIAARLDQPPLLLPARQADDDRASLSGHIGGESHGQSPRSRRVNSFRPIYAVARADFLQRVRSYSFFLTVLFAVLLGYGAATGRVSIHLGDYRGVYTSAWIGTMVAMVTTCFVSLVGFYIVKNAVDRDRRTGVGQILAATPLSKPAYTFGKFLSNFAVLSSMVGILALVALAMQFFAAEDKRHDFRCITPTICPSGSANHGVHRRGGYSF